MGFPGPCVGHPATLTFHFAPNSFAAGDWFRFSADVDGAPGSLAPTWGEEFGTLNVLFAVLMSNGQTLSAPFVTIPGSHSEAAVSLDASPVPAPPTLPLLVTGLAFMALFARRKAVGWRG